MKMYSCSYMYLLESEIYCFVTYGSLFNANIYSFICAQELFLHGNSIGDEGVRALITGLSAHKGSILSKFFFLLNSTISCF